MIDDKTAAELASALEYARLVCRLLPVDPEMDRLAEEAMARRDATVPRRKLKRREP